MLDQVFSQHEFDMKQAKNQIEEALFRDLSLYITIRVQIATRTNYYFINRQYFE